MALPYIQSTDPSGTTSYADPSGAVRILDYSQNPVANPNAPLTSQLRTSLGGALRGELPQDVVDQIRQHAAEFGVASGLSGSEFAGYQGLKNLGLTSLSRITGAENLLANPLLNPRPPTVVPQMNNTVYQPPSNIDWARSTTPNAATVVAPQGAPVRQQQPSINPDWWMNPGQAANPAVAANDIFRKYGGGVGQVDQSGVTLPNYFAGTMGTGNAASEDIPYNPMWSQDQTNAWLAGSVLPTTSGYMSMGQNPNDYTNQLSDDEYNMMMGYQDIPGEIPQYAAGPQYDAGGG